MSEFPNGARSALTMLYLQNQNLSELSPTQLVEKYFEVYDEIDSHYISIKKQRSEKKHDEFYGRSE